MRHLDIGCGPGYLSTIFAINYFESIGVDIIDLSHAMSNKMDFPYLNLNFFNIDCMKDDILHLGQFDIITIDNVIEHVDSPLILVNKVRQVLNHHGIIYLIIPNPHFVDTVKKDPHYQLFGISLLDKKDGDIMVKSLTNLNCYDVNNYFCKYDISNYEAIFSRFGFKWIPFNDIILSTPELQQQCFLQLNCEAVNTYFSNELIKLENRLPNEIFDKLSYVTGIYLRELGAEYEFTKENLNQFTLNHFYLKYLQGSWFFILSLSKA
jgi:SAM-dependent methyltransferase